MAQSFNVSSSMLGVDLNNWTTTALFTPGMHVLGTNGSEWVYAHSATTITAYSLVAISTASYTCGSASGGDLTNGSQLAFAQTSASTQWFGWLALRGIGLTVNCDTSVTAPTGSQILAQGTNIATGLIGICVTVSGDATQVTKALAGISITDATLSSSGTGLITVNVTWPRPASNIQG